MRLIVNADDLGINMTVNDAIFDHISRGLVTSASIIANGPAASDAIRRASAFANTSFGVHLNLTEFSPLTHAAALAPILDKDGHFRMNAIREVPIGATLLWAIYNEWRAQILHIRAMGLAPSHIDSHHHTHTIPSLFVALKGLQVDLGIQNVRTTRNIYANMPPNARKLLLRKKLWHNIVRWTWPSHTTHGFTSFEDFRIVVERGELNLWLRSGIKNLCVEVMVHPGVPQYATETAALDISWFRRKGISLVNYNDI
jgi:predicted glycoside hydrolase/deacetylase ChbG (UPF0249 family)